MVLNIIKTSVDDPDVQKLLTAHTHHCEGASPPESCHFLAADALNHPTITLFGGQDADGRIVAIGALKEMSPTEGEIKSMHTSAQSRGLGAGEAILTTIEHEAAARGYQSLWLETGTMDEFYAARRLYERLGYTVCAPFGSYSIDPNSAYYTKPLSPAGAQ